MANPAVATANKVKTGQQGTQMLSSIFSKYGIFLIFIVMVVAASILSPAFLSGINLINIVRQMSVVGLIALGVTGVIVSAGIDLSSGSVVGLTAVLAVSPGAGPPICNPLLSRCSCSFNCRGAGGLCGRCLGRFAQRQPRSENRHSAVHRYFGHLYCDSRPGLALHRRSSNFGSDRRL